MLLMQKISSCLLDSTFYHPVYGACARPFQEDFCADSSLVVRPDLKTGTAQCLPGLPPCTTRSDVTSGLEAADCGCRDSEVAYDGLCAGLFTEAACPQGKLLLPMYFTVGEKSCPETFECVALDMCPNYRVTKADIMWTPSEELKSSKQDFVSGLLCEETGASVCCPLDSDEALTSSTNILQSFRPPRYECADNPCDEGYWPFEDSDGFMRCFQSKSALSNCRPPSVIQYNNQTEELNCVFFELNNVLGDGHKCRRGQVWSERRSLCIDTFNI